jgi:hypothetical protein
MKTIPPELTAPLSFLKKFKDLYIEDDKLNGWQKITEEFELVSLSPIYRPVANRLAEKFSVSLKFLLDKKPSEFKLQTFKENKEIIEGELIEIFNVQTGETELRPEYLLIEETLPMSSDDKDRLWQEFQMMLNKYVSLCEGFGIILESKIQKKCIEMLVHFEIDDTPLIEFGSREIFSKALIGEIDESLLSKLKIEINTTLGQAAYILNRIKDSGKLTIINKLVDAGSFWKGKKLTWANIRKNKHDYTIDDKKIEIRTVINEKIDGLLALI